MKKLLFVAAIIALVMGTAVDASAKVKKTTKKRAATTRTTTARNTTIQQGMFTNDGATRYANGDVADLEMAFIQDLYMQYVYTGNISNESYFRYIKPKFTDEALEMLKDENGNYDWTIITGKKDGSSGINPSNFFIKRFGQCFEVSGGEHKCYFKIGGEEGAYKITAVSNTPL
jgi:hypothetical protein